MTNGERKRILILGSTGSIGKSACNCVRRFRDRFEVTGLAAGTNVNLLAEQLHEFAPDAVYIRDVNNALTIRERFGKSVKVYDGGGRGSNGGDGYDGDIENDGLVRIVSECDYDILLNALVGAVGFRPTIAALKRGKRVALANKESLVIGGDYIRAIISQNQQKSQPPSTMDGLSPIDALSATVNPTGVIPAILPIDSEHSAILQCLPQGGADASVESIIITASGGPFRNLPKEALTDVTPEQALNHPTWSMGKKITIDSATLMNKAFEVIEAHHLFSLPYDNMRVCVHPQSIIHSLVEFHDGAVIAQLGLPDMELPIQYALSWPSRLPIAGKRLCLSDIRNLEFFEPDMDKFPCLSLCIEAGKIGGTAPAAVNAANEVAVDLFLNKRIGFTDIAKIVESALKEHRAIRADSVEVIEGVDRETRGRILRG